MLLASGFTGLGGGWPIEFVILFHTPFVLAGLLLLGGLWGLIARRGPARWASAAALAVPVGWTLLGEVSRSPLGVNLGPVGSPLLSVLLGAPLGFAATHGVARLLARRPRPIVREVIDSSAIALLPALLAWTTLRLLDALPTQGPPLLLVSPANAALGGLWVAAAAWLTWSRLAARPLSVVELSD